MFFRKLMFVSGLLALSACSNPVKEARTSVLEAVGETAGIEFTSTVEFPHNVVCGEFKQVDKWGEFAGKKRFVYRDREVNLRPDRDDIAIFCSQSPADELQQRFGIVVSGESAAQISQVLEDLTMLAATLERFYDDNDFYPQTGQGLAALKEKPASRFAMRHYPQGGYLDALPLDPWQNPYHYEGPAWGGVKSPFTLRSNGADGAAGGTGEAADIDTTMLPYIRFVAGLPKH